MTIPELKERAAASLAKGVVHLREYGELAMTFELIGRGGTGVFYAVDRPLTNDEAGKRELGAQLKARVAEGDIEAVIHLSDTFRTRDMTPSADKIRLSFGMTIEQAAKAGLCTISECVMCVLQTPVYFQIAFQEYRRDPPGGRRVELVGSPVIEDDTEGAQQMPGRFAFWPTPPRGAGGGREQ